MKVRILEFDIETAPLQAYAWGRWKQNIAMNQLAQDWTILTWAAKWYGEKEIMHDSVHYHGDIFDDSHICRSLHSLLDEADIVVAHNGDRFDIPRVNTRFLANGFAPPSPYKKIDTCSTAKRQFAFTSNRLDDLAQFLGVGKKAETGGFQLWVDCLHGDEAAFEKMIRYNKQDVRILDKVYKKLRPWMPNHPNIGVYVDDTEPRCPKCGSKRLQLRGFSYTQVGKYQRYQCLEDNCASWSRGRFTVQDIENRRALLNNA